MISSLVCALALLGAAPIDTQGLTPAQVAEIQLQAERMKSTASASPTDLAKDAKEWVNVGTAIGQALGSSAKELNVAVNDFAQSPVGQITTVLIVWKVIGNDLMHFILGPLFILTMLPTWWFIWRKVYLIESITYATKDTPKKIVFRSTADLGADAGFYAFMGVAIIIAGIIITFTG